MIRLVAPAEGMTIVDIGCGQGFFPRAFAEAGAHVIGSDISPELIELARKHSDKQTMDFYVTPSDKLSFAADGSADVATVIMALQNIEALANTISECSRVLKKGGRLLIVLNHPAFRVLKNSSWQWDEAAGRQFRRVDSYLSDSRHEIDMNPGESDAAKKKA